MEELAQKIEELIETLNKNSIPIELTIVCMIVPIVISLAVAIFAFVQHHQNKKMQKTISNRDYKAQMHTDILRIYDDCCLAQNKIIGPDNEMHMTFSGAFTLNNGKDLATYYVNDLNSSLSLLCQAANRANILFPKNDTKIRDMIKTIYEKTKELNNKVNEYFYKGMAHNVMVSAWDKITTSYGINNGDYLSLNNNRVAYDTFLEYCKTISTKEMDDMLKELKKLFEYENFDVYFEKYLQMKFEKGVD